MVPHLTRRELLARAAALSALPTWLAPLARAAADGPRASDRCVVIVQLDGGNDGLNTLAPVGDDLYHRLRPSLALKPGAGHRVDAHYAWHPALARLARRFADGGVAVVQGVGYPEPNLSHFTSLDIVQSGTTAVPLPATGWLGRAADARQPGEYPPLTLLALGQDVAPRALRAARGLPVAVPRLEDAAVRAAPAGADEADERARRRALEAFARPAAQPGAATHVAAAARAAKQVALDLARAADFTPAVEWPDSALARDLQLVARVLDKGLPTRFFHVAQGGYDTHAIQAEPHAALLSALDGALDAFLRELTARGLHERVLILTVSEFGRRVAQNGFGDRAGTDHGAASLQLALGAGIEPGIHGPPPDLAALDPHGNLRHTTDFRTVYAGVLQRWLGVDAGAVLGAPFAPHPALRASS